MFTKKFHSYDDSQHYNMGENQEVYGRGTKDYPQVSVRPSHIWLERSGLELNVHTGENPRVIKLCYHANYFKLSQAGPILHKKNSTV